VAMEGIFSVLIFNLIFIEVCPCMICYIFHFLTFLETQMSVSNLVRCGKKNIHNELLQRRKKRENLLENVFFD
jgi:hypothetical protein